ncbi:MAG: hypothetical protein FWF15_00560 [Oscillospiraceae bacterium]|nr:hypothetical protein [Oscillospiraceae bacterium]
MFNSEEIAKRVLLRAEEIKAVRKHKRNLIQASAVTVCLCAMLFAFAVLIFPLTDFHDITGPFMIPLSTPVMPDENAKPYTATELEYPLPLAEHKVILQSYDSITIPANSPDVQIFLVNPTGNNCCFVFEITLEDTNEVLYISGLVKPGMYLENITLLKTLEKGEYNAVLVIYTYDPENQTATRNSTIKFDLIAV